jgi:hypothetical protein
MKWTLIALLGGAPVPTGFTYASLECMAAAEQFLTETRGSLAGARRGHMEPSYACIPKSGDQP